MNDQRKMLAAAVALCIQQGMLPNEKSIKKVIPQLQQLDPEQFNQLATMGEQLLQQAEQQLKSAKVAALGTKLDYINKLKGICPEGTEKVYLAKGGCMCKQKAKEGTELKPKKMNAIEKFKAEKALGGTKFNEKEERRLYAKDMKSAKDQAAKDSIQINKYSDLETLEKSGHKGSYKHTKDGSIWTPDRSKYKTEKKACGGTTKKHLLGGAVISLKPNFANMAKKPNMNPLLFAENLKWRRDIPYKLAGYDPDNLDSLMSLELEKAAYSGKGIDNYMNKWAKKNKDPYNQMLYKRFIEMGGPQMRDGKVSDAVGKDLTGPLTKPKPGKMVTGGY